MSSELFSASWYRVASLRVQLRSHAQMVRHRYRGERWYLLQDMANGRFLRLNEAAWRIVALMDGHRTMEEIWQQACLTMGDTAPTQDEVLQVLSQLHQSNLLLSDRKPDIDEMQQRRQKGRLLKLKQYIANPLSLKIPLFDPDRLLGWLVKPWAAAPGATHVTHIAPGVRWARRVAWLLWVLLMGFGIGSVAMHWDELSQDMTSRVFTPENMVLLWLAFPLVKAIHELGHGLVLKALGGACHEMGLMILVMVPIPYIDVSPSVAFVDKRHRMLVGMAGMMAELAIAAVAIGLWSWATPGVHRAFLYQVVILAGITTVLFNANPLLRFDGYYVLADWLEIPNLGQKSTRYLHYVLNRYLFGVTSETARPHVGPREGPWLLGFAVCSIGYRLLISAAILLMVAEHFFFAGVLMALWAGYSMLVLPVLRFVRWLAESELLTGVRQRAVLVSGGGTLALVLLLLWLPVPSWTMAEGVIWMPEQARIRAPLNCFGAHVLARPGQMVAAGDPLLICEEPELERLQEQIGARIRELESRAVLARTVDRVAHQIVEAELGYTREHWEDVAKRRQAMVMTAPHAGRFVMPTPADFAGRWLERGDVLGYVLDPARFTLLTVVPQADVDQVRTRTQRVELRSVDRVDVLLQARIGREVPAASHELPSLALSLQGGGRIGLDPSSQPDGGSRAPVRAIVSLFQFEVYFMAGEDGERVPRTLGSRVFVRFIHPPEPLLAQWYRTLRQLFLKRFAV